MRNWAETSLFASHFRLLAVIVLLLMASGASAFFGIFLIPELAEASAKTHASIRLPAGAESEWWFEVQRYIRRSEYRVAWQDHSYLPDVKAAYQAPNRAQNLRIYFTPDGVRIIPRTSKGDDWVWGLSLKGYGFKGDIKPVVPAKLSSSGNRIEYRREGLTEWYINDERGLEQGFTLNDPPVSQGPDPGSWIVFEIGLYGNLKANLNKRADQVEFATSGGVSVVRYHELHAVDASGRELPAKFALFDTRIDILVDANSALYPITIDPLAESTDWKVESDQAYAFLGFSVSTAGDVNGDGYSDVIVGAPFYDNGEIDEGMAFVYHGSSSGLSTTPNWTGEGGQAHVYFGISVSTAGDVNGDGYSDVIAGAIGYDNGETNEGTAFLYRGSSSGLGASAAWTADSDQGNSLFGYSVATAGDVNGDGYSDVIIGARSYENGLDFDEGMVFVFYGQK